MYLLTKLLGDLPMKRLLLRLSLLFVVAWIVACTSKTDIFLPYDENINLPEDLADAPVDQLLLDGRESFTYLRTFPVESAYHIQLPGSIGINFPAGEWMTTTGEIVEGLVTARIIAAKAPAELLLSNVSSLADDQLLSMLGAVRIELFSEGRPLHPTGNYTIELDYPISAPGESWQLYFTSSATDNWQLLADLSPTPISVKDYETGEALPALRFQPPWGGWFALARDLQPEFPSLTQLSVQVPQGWTANWLSVFAILPSESSVLRLRPVMDNNLTFQTNDLPANQNVQLIGLGRDEMGQIFFGILEIQTDPEMTDVSLDLMLVNESALSSLLGL
jgi:hypothetical protein